MSIPRTKEILTSQQTSAAILYQTEKQTYDKLILILKSDIIPRHSRYFMADIFHYVNIRAYSTAPLILGRAAILPFWPSEPDRAPKSLQLPLSELSANLEDSLDIPSFRVAVYLSIPHIRCRISVSRINPVSPYISRLFPGDLTVKEQ